MARPLVFLLTLFALLVAPLALASDAPPNLGEAVHRVALGMPAAWGEAEAPEERVLRLEIVSESIAEASDRDDWPGSSAELAAALLTKAWFESKLARWVHVAGARKDNGGYAISLWSLHSWNLVPYSEWRTLGGLAGTAGAADAAARVLTWARNRCGARRADWPEAMFALFATGKRCRWSGAGNRAWVYRRVLRSLERELSTAS